MEVASCADVVIPDNPLDLASVAMKNELPGDPTLSPGVLPQDVSDREPDEDDEFWRQWWNQQEPEDKEP